MYVTFILKNPIGFAKKIKVVEYFAFLKTTFIIFLKINVYLLYRIVEIKKSRNV